MLLKVWNHRFIFVSCWTCRIMLYMCRNVQVQVLWCQVLVWRRGSWRCCFGWFYLTCLNKAHRNMAGLRFSSLQCKDLRWLRTCHGNDCPCARTRSVTWAHRQTDKHKQSSSSVELFDSKSGTRSTKQSGTLFWCVPPAQSAHKEVSNDNHNLQQVPFQVDLVPI